MAIPKSYPRFSFFSRTFAAKFSESESEFETINKLKYMEHDFISFKLWRQIKNTAIYISKSGGCVTKSLRTGICYPRIDIPKNPRGHSHYPYFNMCLTDGNKRLKLYPHRVVALTYLPNHDLFKNQVDHLDGNIFNNNLWNLEWVTEAENHRRAKEARCLKKLKVKS